MWEKSLSSVITISNMTSSGLVAIVWEESSKTVAHADRLHKSKLYIIDKHGQLKNENNTDMTSSPNAAVLHDRFFACVYPYPTRQLRCFSLIDNKWMWWFEGITRYGKSTLSIVDDDITLSRQKDGGIIFKININGDKKLF